MMTYLSRNLRFYDVQVLKYHPFLTALLPHEVIAMCGMR